MGPRLLTRPRRGGAVHALTPHPSLPAPSLPRAAVSSARAQAAATPSVIYVGTVTLQVKHSGKCLEVAGWRTRNGAPARLWTCTDQPSQYFSITAA
ncbi:RICIN domain-containing protein [Streptomyces sp. NPDC048018]|uniref:RICIN domain-containing protein n=1 Tax=Streptomyces sp. NPDC048018 TaxID=3365499 RepID=UPI0037239EA9